MSTTLPQMRARALDGHYDALRALDEGRPVLGPTARPGEVRGMHTILRTLRRWGAIEGDGELTEIGRQLLASRS